MASVKGFVVTMARDLDDEDAERVRDALELIRGVVSVRPVGSRYQDTMIEDRVRRELESKLFDVVRGK